MSAPLEDPRAFRQDSRARWGRAAAGWEAQGDALRRASMPVSTWLIEALGPQPGHDLLELAAGTGETGFLAAELIAPSGTLWSTDFAPEMLSAGQARAEALGLRNVRFKQVDAEAEIDFPAASLDGILCRWGFMLMADPGAALRECRRVLRPGGRLALAAWTGPEDNQWSALPTRVLLDRGLTEPPDPSVPGQFTWAAEGVAAEHVEAAGFGDVTTEQVGFVFRWPSFESYWSWLLDTSLGFATAHAGLDAPTRGAVREEVAAQVGERFGSPEGGLELPARTWVVAASA